MFLGFLKQVNIKKDFSSETKEIQNSQRQPQQLQVSVGLLRGMGKS